MRSGGVLLVGAAVGALVVAVGGAWAAPKSGCSAEESDWALMTVQGASDRIWPGLLDTSPWGGEQAQFTAVVRTYDRNADDHVCLKVMWGEKLNPNSHWYLVGQEILGSPTEQYLARDNTANASP